MKVQKDLPGVAYVDGPEQLREVISDAIENDSGEYLDSAQIKNFLARSRERAFA